MAGFIIGSWCQRHIEKQKRIIAVQRLKIHLAQSFVKKQSYSGNLQLALSPAPEDELTIQIYEAARAAGIDPEKE